MNCNHKQFRLLAQHQPKAAIREDEPRPLVVSGMQFALVGTVYDDLTTYDVDFQHRFSLGTRNRVVWGLGYRHTHDAVIDALSVGFFPAVLGQNLYSGFVAGP